MKFYRVHVTVECGVSTGYEYFTSKYGAARAVREWEIHRGEETGSAEIEVIEIAPTKAGILHALNAYAAHADNG
jgi:hypothetical protein